MKVADNSKIHLIGNAHLDPVWLWTWQEGCGEVLQTFRSALDRLNEYDDFIFTCSSAAYYKWVEEIAPDMFEEIKHRVREGRWLPVNGWWVQPDCNIPNAEAFARQALYSQLYYYEKFGKICTVGYNVDSFGHNANMPQLLRESGMTAYVMMRPGPHENPDIPQTFLWEGTDGSKVITFRIAVSYTCSGREELERAVKACENAIKENKHDTMLFYGVGNHGGGPTKRDIEYLKGLAGEKVGPQLKFSSPDEYFQSLCLQLVDLPVWREELQHHASGCYSAMSEVKQLNRRAENSLYAAEAFSCVAAKIAAMREKTEAFKQAWRELCFNQFHDILCGCSIFQAYDDVRASMGHALNISAKACNEALLRIAGNIDTRPEGVSQPKAPARNQDCGLFPRPVVIFNPLSFDIKVPVRVYNASSEVKDSQGKAVVFQNLRSSRSNDSHLDTCFIAEIPALGYSVYRLKWLREGDKISPAPTAVSAEGLVMENEYLRVKFSQSEGTVISLVDKLSGFDYASREKPLAVPTVIKDEKSDTWAHNVFKFHDVKGIMKLESIELAEAGPVRALIRTRHSFGGSYLTQDFILAAGQKTLRVKCRVLWRESFTLLKMSFPVDGENAACTYEIPGAFIKRPCNGEEEPAGRFGGISFDKNGRRSLCVLNDSKYSYDCPGNDFRITLLRNVIFADHYSHRPPADFNFTDEGLSRFEYGLCVFDGEISSSCIVKQAAQFNVRPIVVPEGYHKGSLPQKQGFIKISAENIIMTAFKLCEDGSGDAVIRLYETQGRESRTSIICDIVNAAFKADFQKHEIKTFRITAEGRAFETDFMEGIAKTF